MPGLLIDKVDVPALSGRSFVRQGPVADLPPPVAAAGGVEDARRAVDAATAAFPAWSETGPTARRAILLRAADRMEARAAEFGRNAHRAMVVARRLQSGICHINGPPVADEAQMPFGGVKGSGYGRFGGRAGIAEFTDLRWITMEGAQHYPF